MIKATIKSLTGNEESIVVVMNIPIPGSHWISFNDEERIRQQKDIEKIHTLRLGDVLVDFKYDSR